MTDTRIDWDSEPVPPSEAWVLPNGSVWVAPCKGVLKVDGNRVQFHCEGAGRIIDLGEFDKGTASRIR